MDFLFLELKSQYFCLCVCDHVVYVCVVSESFLRIEFKENDIEPENLFSPHFSASQIFFKYLGFLIVISLITLILRK